MTGDLRVALNECGEYDEKAIEGLLRAQFEALGADRGLFEGKKTVIKPNLVSPCAPEAATTTHPAVIYAAAKIVKEYGADAVIAESPGGLYNESVLKLIYRVTGAADAAERAGVPLNYGLEYGGFEAPKGQASRLFEIIKPVLDADIVVDLCKLKTHTLTQLSANAKNLFGCVPGVFKAEQHARFPNQTEFMRALVDLAEAICDAKTVLCVTDAVVGMEGNGPSGGNPRAIGCILSSFNPFAADLVCAAIVGQGESGRESDTVKMLKFAGERGLCPDSAAGVKLIGDEIARFKVAGYVQPDTKLKKWFDFIPSFLSPRPDIDYSKCVGCGKCAANCPPHTISMEEIKGKKRPVIKKSGCIHCFCCQELCPIHAIRVKKNPIFKIIK